jgi:hypothetical protein
MSYYLSPIGNSQFVDTNGAPLSGGFLWSYAAGTTTPITTYADDAGTPQTNPIVLNSAGRPTLGPVWLDGGQAVKFVLQNAQAVPLYTWDDVTGVNDPANASAADQWVLYTAAPTYISATSFSVVGDQTNLFQVGRRVKTANTGGTVYSTIFTSSYNGGTQLTTVVLINDSGTLDAGLSSVAYGLLSSLLRSIPTAGPPYFGQCRLELTGGNLVLSRQNGTQLTIGGVNYTVPASGVSLAPAGLSTGTFHLIYAYMNAGAMALEASTTVRATDATTGMQIKNGDSSRTLVGGAYVTAGPAFADTAANRMVRSWFNRQRQDILGAEVASTRTTASTSLVELNTETRANFVIWSDESLTAYASGWSFNGGANETATSVGVDGVATKTPLNTTFGTTGGPASSSGTITGLADGLHYITLAGVVSGGTGSWAAASGATRGGARVGGFVA